MKRVPRSVAAAAGNDQPQAAQTGSDTPPADDQAAASDTSASDESDTSGSGETQLPAGDTAETPPAAGAGEAATKPAEADEPLTGDIEVRVLVAYDDRLPNDVIVIDRAEAATRAEQVDADPIAVAYAKSLVA